MLDGSDAAVYADNFANSQIVGIRYLGMRDLPQLIKKHVRGTGALDYGCGPAISTTFLKSAVGLHPVDGVDVCPKMIAKAKERDAGGRYAVIKSGEVPAPDAHYDLVLSCFVFMSVCAKQQLVKIFAEIKRILTPDGCLIAVVHSEAMYNADWSTVDARFAENVNLRSGAAVRVLLKDVNVVLRQYFWSENDYREVCDRSGLTIVEVVRPMGGPDDGYEWAGEEAAQPLLTLVIKKTDQPSADKNV